MTPDAADVQRTIKTPANADVPKCYRTTGQAPDTNALGGQNTRTVFVRPVFVLGDRTPDKRRDQHHSRADSRVIFSVATPELRAPDLMHTAENFESTRLAALGSTLSRIIRRSGRELSPRPRYGCA